MNQLEKDKADVYSLRGNHKELIKTINNIKITVKI